MQLIIVVTEDAVLVCHKDKEQEIKSLLEHMKQMNEGESPDGSIS